MPRVKKPKTDWTNVARRVLATVLSLPSYLILALGIALLLIITIHPLNQKVNPALEAVQLVSPEQSYDIISVSPLMAFWVFLFSSIMILLTLLFIRSILSAAVMYFGFKRWTAFWIKLVLGAVSWIAIGFIVQSVLSLHDASVLWSTVWSLLFIMLVGFALEVLLLGHATDEKERELAKSLD